MPRPTTIDSCGKTSIRLSPENYEIIEKIKKKNNCNTSEAVRFALEYVNLVIDAQ